MARLKKSSVPSVISMVKKREERMLRLLACVLAALLLLCCVDPAQALDRVRIGKSGVALAWTMIEAGDSAGIWQEQGLAIEASQLSGDAQLQQALTAGELDFGLGSGPGMGYRVKGVPAIAIAAIAGPPHSFMLFVRPDSAIKSVAELKGRNVAVTSAGSLTDWLVRELSRQQGWGPEGIVSLPMGALRTKMAALKGGEIDSVLLTSGSVYEFEEQGQARIIASFGDLVRDFHTHVLYAPDRLVSSNEDLVRRFIAGWFRSVAFMREHRQEGVRIAARTLEIGESAASKAFDQDMKMMSPDGGFSRAAIEVIRRSLVELGILDKIPEASALYTDRFVPVRD
jgi:NitT/TauT family transport system substrate-binding protein